MASWFERITPKFISNSKKTNVPVGVWVKCPSCGETLYHKDLEKNLKVCLNCEYHFRISSKERFEHLFDNQEWEEKYTGILTKDPLKFVDSKKYKDRIKTARSKSKLEEAVSVSVGKIEGQKVCMAVFDFAFMGGSMGSVVGEKITRGIEYSIDHKIPMLIVSSSGGARMQEGAISLMQMAKTSAALQKLASLGLPYLSILTDPTTGGVSASFAMLGDVNIAEKNALIGFAGARVIQETINEDLPEGFQRAEFLKKHGTVDMIVNRTDLKKTIGDLLRMLYPQ
jgi:acetyl-CoA carboxylase carboxyl transferase subunit beta